MAIYTNLPIYKTAYQLLLDLTRNESNLPRSIRFTLGQRLQDSVMNVLTQIYKANSTRQKLPLIIDMRTKVAEIQVYIRLLSDLHHISESLYTKLAEQTASMSKQLSAWERSVREKKESPTQSQNLHGQGCEESATVNSI